VAVAVAVVPASRRFPTRHASDFASAAEDSLAWGFADLYGSFAVRTGLGPGPGQGPGPTTGAAAPATTATVPAVKALTQVAMDEPTGWAPKNLDPLTVRRQFFVSFVWCLVFGVWCLVFGVWCLVLLLLFVFFCLF
jgi:hypothetical protein